MLHGQSTVGPDSLNGDSLVKMEVLREACVGYRLHERARAALPSMSHSLQQLRERGHDVDVRRRTAAQNVSAHASSTISAWRWAPVHSMGSKAPFGGRAVVARACSVPRCGGRDGPLGLKPRRLTRGQLIAARGGRGDGGRYGGGKVGGVVHSSTFQKTGDRLVLEAIGAAGEVRHAARMKQGGEACARSGRAARSTSARWIMMRNGAARRGTPPAMHDARIAVAWQSPHTKSVGSVSFGARLGA